MGKDRANLGSGLGQAAKKSSRSQFRHKSLNSFLPLNLEIWKENFEKGKS
jgi:hypothetical protein